MKWPKFVEDVLIEKRFREVEKGLYALKSNDLYYLLALRGGEGELAKLHAAVWAPGLSTGGKDIAYSDIYSLPIGGAVSQNSVGSDAGQAYWVADEVADETGFASQLVELINEIVLPWFCAFKGRNDLSGAFTIEGETIAFEVNDRVECAGDELGIHLENSGISCNDAYKRYSNKAFLEGPAEVLGKALGEFGFQSSISDGIRYYRYRSDIGLYDILYPRCIAFGARLILDLFILVPEFELAHHVDELPEDLLVVNGGVLADSGIQAYPYLTERCSVPFHSDWVNSVTTRITSIALPWFDSIGDRQGLLSSVREDFRPLLGTSFVGSTSLSQMILGQI
ncbi:MAG: hypothetical protein KZQ73_12045 [Candidatus Thiodiazotropha sp. (ex Semelilucina semeliformis)]|nr:hypothetical protein [Candidatus Thiodiazotropha sp. (ex Semelilucina semeliformis)]